MLRVKALILLSIVVLSTLYATKRSESWLNWDDAVMQAKATQKPLLIKVVQEDCHYCTDMQRDVFDKPDMKAFLEKNFTLVKVDLNRDGVPLGHKISMTPSFLFLTPEKKLIKKIPGSWKKDEFMGMLKSVLKQEVL